MLGFAVYALLCVWHVWLMYSRDENVFKILALFTYDLRIYVLVYEDDYTCVCILICCMSMYGTCMSVETTRVCVCVTSPGICLCDCPIYAEI